MLVVTQNAYNKSKEIGGRYWVRTSDPCRVKAEHRCISKFPDVFIRLFFNKLVLSESFRTALAMALARDAIQASCEPFFGSPPALNAFAATPPVATTSAHAGACISAKK